MSDEESLNLSSNTRVGMPLRNLAFIVTLAAGAVVGYTQLEGRIGDLETAHKLAGSDLEQVTKWSDELQRGELSTAATQELFLLLEMISKQVETIEADLATFGKAVSVNEQQDLKIQFLLDRVRASEARLEGLRDSFSDLKANGQGAH
tara:strand:+ start:100 stop:543 length:444 start_codon:yes stop_codon:yes gene_type:complete